MENKSHALAAGLFVLLVTGLVLALAAWLARDAGGRTVYEIVSTQAVTGLQPQAAVRYRGVAVGKVESIGLDPQVRGQVLVRIAVLESTPVTSSTFATLDLAGVTGLSFVQLDDSSTGAALVAGSASGSPHRIPLRAGLLATLSQKGANALEKAEETSRRLNELLDSQNQKTLMASVQSLGQAAQSLGQLSQSLDSTVRQQLRPALASLPALGQSVERSLQALQGTSADISRAAQATTQAAGEFGKGAGALGTTLQRVNAPGGTLDQLGSGSAALTQAAQDLASQTLPRVGHLAQESRRAARALARTAKDLGDNPQSLLYGNPDAAPGPGEAGFVAPRSAGRNTP